MGKTAAFYDRDLPRLLFTLYSEGYVIERVGVFLPKLPKGQLIKCFNYGVRRRKTGEKVIFSSCCGGETAVFYGRGLSCLLSISYSEKTAFQRVFCWRTLWLKHFTDSLWVCPNYFSLARTAPKYLSSLYCGNILTHLTTRPHTKGSVTVCSCFISTVRWKYRLFIQFFH